MWKMQEWQKDCHSCFISDTMFGRIYPIDSSDNSHLKTLPPISSEALRMKFMNHAVALRQLNKVWGIVLVASLVLLQFATLSVGREPKMRLLKQTFFAKRIWLAWCIVPFDRGNGRPEQRAGHA
jgi:hypothetical protein